MEEFITNKTPIYVDLSPNRDEVYGGICTKWNEEILVLINLNDETNQYDGCSILLNQDVEKYRELDPTELSEIKNHNSADFENSIDVLNLNNLTDCLSVLQLKDLVAIFTKDDDKSYYVGKITDVNENSIKLRLLDENAKWIETETINISEINYIGFDTKHEIELLENAL